MAEDRTEIDAENAADKLLDSARALASRNKGITEELVVGQAQTFALMAIAYELRAARAVAGETRDMLDAIYGKLDALDDTIAAAGRSG